MRGFVSVKVGDILGKLSYYFIIVSAHMAPCDHFLIYMFSTKQNYSFRKIKI